MHADAHDIEIVDNYQNAELIKFNEQKSSKEEIEDKDKDERSR